MEFKLGELIEIKHGYAFKGKDFVDTYTNRILLTPGNFFIGGGFNPAKEKYYSKEAALSEDYILKEDDLIITMTDLSKDGDTLGYPALIPKSEEKIYLHNQRLGRVTIKDSMLIDKYYLYFLMRTSEYRHHVLSASSGTTVKHTSPNKILNYQVTLPDLQRQKKISNTLMMIENKIINNLEIIANLKKINQNLFKRWFVDFEFLNENGEPYKSSGGEMAESELGEVPKEWSVEKVGLIADFKNGKKITEQNRQSNGKNKIFGSNGVIGFTNEVLQNSPSIIIGRVGANCGSLMTSLRECWVTDNAIIGTVKDIKYYSFLYMTLSRVGLKDKAGGSAQPLINQTILKKISIALPNEEVLEKYHYISYRYVQMVEVLEEENKQLSKLLQTLLIKLYSGEIEIPYTIEVK